MKQVRIFHCISFVMMIGYGMIASRRFDQAAFLFWGLIIGYLVLILGVFRGTKLSLKLSVIPPALAFLYTAPTVLYNLVAFIFGHPLYKDSPVTILVVGVVAVFVTVPCGLVLVSYWKQRKLLFGQRKTGR
jgi:hypothetical protein